MTLRAEFRPSGFCTGLFADLRCQSLPPPVDIHYLGNGHNSTSHHWDIKEILALGGLTCT